MTLFSEMASNTEAMEQKEREHKTEIDALNNSRAMLEVSLPHMTYDILYTVYFIWAQPVYTCYL